MRTVHAQQASLGFTLVELVMVIVILGVLAVFVAPRLVDKHDLYAKGFHDETLAYLRYAQKTAIAQRRTVCIAFGTNSLSLQIALNAPTGATTNADCTAFAPSFVGPKGESPPLLSAKGSVIYSPTPTTLNFNGLGQPTSGAGVVLTTRSSLQVQGAPNTIIVEAATGYVHD